MGESKRRGKSTVIRGPSAYQLGVYRLDDIFEGRVRMLLGERVSDQTVTLLHVTANLARRMGDRSLPTMLCALCDHEFAHDAQPTEILIALSWANSKRPPIASPICAACAEMGEDDKANMVKASWLRLSPESSCLDEPGHA